MSERISREWSSSSLATYAPVYEIAPMPGQALDFEEALKQHMQWARQQDSDWGWNTYEIIAGKCVGNYLVLSGNRSWKTPR